MKNHVYYDTESLVYQEAVKIIKKYYPVIGSDSYSTKIAESIISHVLSYSDHEHSSLGLSDDMLTIFYGECIGMYGPNDSFSFHIEDLELKKDVTSSLFEKLHFMSQEIYDKYQRKIEHEAMSDPTVHNRSIGDSLKKLLND
jgi:hypothetical protein